MKKRIAIIGSGISALTSAYYLKKDYELSLFEAGDYIGGHTNTLTVDDPSGPLNVDTGFIVFNDWTYPNFIKLMDQNNVEWQDSDMSFSVKSAKEDFEYNGTSLNGLFAQRSNILRPRYWRMVKDILRFYSNAKAWLEQNPDDSPVTLGQYLKEHDYSDIFRDYHLIPVTAAIWSAGRQEVLDMPLRFFLRFLKNHGMMNVNERPVWRVIKGGSKSYIPKLIQGIEAQIHLSSPVQSVRRTKDKAYLTIADQEFEFDAVIMALHSDQALKILSDATELEKEILASFPYQENEAVLHTDQAVLPKRKLAHAAWNYHILDDEFNRVAVTYNMNILQGLKTEKSYNVTLNYSQGIDPKKVIKKIKYHHPIFTLEGVAAQKRHSEISGQNNTYYCGAYWRNGFHEDGVVSGMRVAKQLGMELEIHD